MKHFIMMNEEGDNEVMSGERTNESKSDRATNIPAAINVPKVWLDILQIYQISASPYPFMRTTPVYHRQSIQCGIHSKEDLPQQNVLLQYVTDSIKIIGVVITTVCRILAILWWRTECCKAFNRKTICAYSLVIYYKTKESTAPGSIRMTSWTK